LFDDEIDDLDDEIAALEKDAKGVGPRKHM